MSLRRLSRPLGLALTGLLATAALALVPASAQARIAAPSGLAPNGPTSSNTPTFTWNRVSGATQYDLVISAGGNALVQTTTANNRWVPTSNLPDGDITWQVRADSQSGNSSWASASATISSAAAPSPVSPVGGTVLTQPDNPPLFTWSPVAGAIGYEVQVDNTGSWTSPTTYSPSGTSYFVELPAGSRHLVLARPRQPWQRPLHRVEQHGDVRRRPARRPPARRGHDAGRAMQDVSIDWQPVPGATEYQLQVGKDPDFNNIVDDQTGRLWAPASSPTSDLHQRPVLLAGARDRRGRHADAVDDGRAVHLPAQLAAEADAGVPAQPVHPDRGQPDVLPVDAGPHAPARTSSTSGSDPNFSPGTYFTCTHDLHDVRRERRTAAARSARARPPTGG